MLFQNTYSFFFPLKLYFFNFLFKISFLFQGSFRFTEKLQRQSRKFQCTQHSVSSVFKISYECGKFVTADVTTNSVDYLLSHVQVFCDPRDCSPPGSSVHRDSHARILKWVAISSPGDRPNQEWNPHPLHWQADSLPLNCLGSLS